MLLSESLTVTSMEESDMSLEMPRNLKRGPGKPGNHSTNRNLSLQLETPCTKRIYLGPSRRLVGYVVIIIKSAGCIGFRNICPVPKDLHYYNFIFVPVVNLTFALYKTP